MIYKKCREKKKLGRSNFPTWKYKPDSVQDKVQYKWNVYLHFSREEAARVKNSVLHRMWLSPAKRCSLPTVFNLPIFLKKLQRIPVLEGFGYRTN